MKIIIVGPAYPYRGGIADTNESFCRALQQLGHEVSIMTFTVQYPAILFPGKTQYSTDPAPSDLTITRSINSVNPLNWLATARKINEQNADLVIVRYWLPFLAASLGTIARRIGSKTKLVALCDNIIPHEKRLGDDALTRYFVDSFDAFVTMSGTVQSELAELADKPQLCIPHPINDNLGELQEKSSSRAHLGLEQDQKYLLFFGLVRKYKGLDLLLKAMGDRRLAKLNINLVIAGEWYDSTSEYDAIIEEMELKDRLVVRNEFIPSADIQHYFSAVDLVTQTYHTASQSGVTQIAFHFEKPILVTDVGGLSEVVHHGKLGYVTEKDPFDIATYILEYFTKADQESMAKNIKAEKQKYSWSAFSQQVVDMASKL